MAIMAFMSSLPIRKIGGIGKVTEKILREVLGISTSEVMLKKGGLLSALFCRPSADFFLCVGLGLGKTDAPEVKMRKSMSNERTFSATADEGVLLQKLAELVEMLAADLQKEGLHGKTVTLKLKTSSFEVRTRAVTLWKYTCSSKEILKEASKLLKAEFPISARLIGLRVSHFREDICDHTQKSIMNFVISGDSSGNKAIDHNCLESNATADVFMVEQADDLSSINFACNSSREGHNHQLQEDSGTERCAFNTCALECHKNDRTQDDHYQEMNYPGAASYGCVPEPHDLYGQQLASTNQKTEEEQRNTTNPSSDDASSSTHQEQLVWVDGYKCSICGIELPSVFVEERIEHFDFHLAERLQEDESGTGSNSTGHLGKPRFVEKDRSRRLSGRKKHKASREKCEYLPIDIFFDKK